jgi:2-haloalkanoic acid dehalogenase type II
LSATRRYDAVLFDLLTALLDSWTLWNSVAGSEDAGRRWRAEYLHITYATGRYRPYETLVGDAAMAVGLPPSFAEVLSARYGEIAPWPEAPVVLGSLHHSGLPLGVVTNCSETLGRLAANRAGVPFGVVVTAERAGFYKPDPHPYRLALQELGVAPGRCLFVAGSAFDLFGTARVGLPTWWHDRIGMALPPGAPPPLDRHATLAPLLGEFGLQPLP